MEKMLNRPDNPRVTGCDQAVTLATTGFRRRASQINEEFPGSQAMTPTGPKATHRSNTKRITMKRMLNLPDDDDDDDDDHHHHHHHEDDGECNSLGIPRVTNCDQAVTRATIGFQRRANQNH